MCRCLVKIFLFVVNLLFSLVGLLIIGLGVFVIYQLRSIEDQLPYDINIDFVPYVVIGIGVVVFLIAFSGCCGSITETKCLLITYAVCMAVLAAAKIVITILLFVNLSNFTNEVKTVINDMFVSDDTVMNGTFHVLEMQFKCCGTTGPDSYINDYNLASPTCCELNRNATTLPIENLPGNLTIDDVPANISIDNLPANIPTEYLPENLPIGILQIGNLTMCKKEDAFQFGCTEKIGQIVSSYLRSFGIGMIVVLCFELLAMSFSIYLIRTMTPRKVEQNHGMVNQRYYY